jgi:tRNA G46 methylase TrmB
LRAFASEKLKTPPHARYDELARLRGPLDLEIGCGVGWHPIAYARAHPDRSLVALERTSAKFAAFERRLARHEPLEGLLPVHADVEPWLARAPAGLRFSRVFLLYPNPEPSRPSRRWFRSPFFARLLQSLAPDGSIELRTNEAEYANEAREWAARQWRLELTDNEEWNRMGGRAPETHFERKYLAAGQTLHRLVFRPSAST